MEQFLSRYKRDLALRGYSPRAQDHYFRNAKQFLSFYNIPAERLDPEKIKDYLYYPLEEQKASDSLFAPGNSRFVKLKLKPETPGHVIARLFIWTAS